MEPRKQREEGVDMFIDLGATAVDHGDTGNEKDVTMQAGKQRAVLPLIRKFNEHSVRLLNTSLYVLNVLCHLLLLMIQQRRTARKTEKNRFGK